MAKEFKVGDKLILQTSDNKLANGAVIAVDTEIEITLETNFSHSIKFNQNDNYKSKR